MWYSNQKKVVPRCCKPSTVQVLESKEIEMVPNPSQQREESLVKMQNSGQTLWKSLCDALL